MHDNEQAFQVVLVVKNPPANTGDVRDNPGLIPGLGRSSGEGNATYSSTFAWRLPWTEELGGLHTVQRLTESDTTEQLSTHTHIMNVEEVFVG